MWASKRFIDLILKLDLLIFILVLVTQPVHWLKNSSSNGPVSTTVFLTDFINFISFLAQDNKSNSFYHITFKLVSKRLFWLILAMELQQERTNISFNKTLPPASDSVYKSGSNPRAEQVIHCCCTCACWVYRVAALTPKHWMDLTLLFLWL